MLFRIRTFHFYPDEYLTRLDHVDLLVTVLFLGHDFFVSYNNKKNKKIYFFYFKNSLNIFHVLLYGLLELAQVDLTRVFDEQVEGGVLPVLEENGAA